MGFAVTYGPFREAGVVFGVLVAGSGPASPPRLACRHGSPPSPTSPVAPLIWTGILALAIVAFAAGTWPRRHREAPLRREMRTRQEVTYRVNVSVKNLIGMRMRGPLSLIVREDAFEVTHAFPPARFLFGQEYAYRAEHTTIQAVPEVLRRWIEVHGQPRRVGRADLDQAQPPEPRDLGRASQGRCATNRLAPAMSVPIVTRTLSLLAGARR